VRDAERCRVEPPQGTPWSRVQAAQKEKAGSAPGLEM
jgi:hypothetical protein